MKELANRRWGLGALLACLLLAVPARAQVTVVDDFEDVSAWAPVAADGVSVDLARDAGVAGHALRIDFDFHGEAGYAIARRPVALRLPAGYRLRLWLRAEAAGGGPAPVNDLELKLVGASGEDVWWHNRRRFAYPEAWTPLTTKPRHVSFAWGPAGGGVPTDLSAIEIAVTAQEGGRGSVWIDSLTVEAVPDAGPYTGTPSASATAGRGADLATDGDPQTAWTAPGPAALTLDFGRERDLGGLTLDWGDAHAPDYDVETSDDGARWAVRYRARGSDGGRDVVPIPDTDARYVRISAFQAPDGVVLREVRVEPLDFAATPNDLYRRIAADAPRGHYPRYLVGEASYWTVVGADSDEAEALVSEDGAVEVGAFSVEPFLVHGGRLLSWAGATTAHTLADGSLPVPTVRSTWPGRLTLETTAWVTGADSAATLSVRYRVRLDAPADTVRLALALRPFLVNPAHQFLSAPSGVSEVRSVRRTARGLVADGRAVVADRAPDAVAMATFDGGGVVRRLADARLDEAERVDDPAGRAEAVMRFDLPLSPEHPVQDVVVSVPMTRDGTAQPGPVEAAVEAWRARVGRFEVRGSAEAEALGQAARAQIGYVLVNRDGPAVQPGSRAYDRSWIRDGALTSDAMLRVGLPDVAARFARWYAPFQYANGKVPCCVDGRGADPVPEHDSHGELVYLIAETFRYTRDRAFLRAMWPHVRGAVAFMDSIRAATLAFDTDATRHLRGLMPPSISHEGYSAKPAYSYWDDLWALRGYRDAVFVAGELGEPTAGLAASRDAFESDLAASVRATLAVHGLTTLPGAADLGDFDATSTSIALDPVSAGAVLPTDPLRATFDRYWAFFEARARADDWEAYTPYEWRNVGAMLRLGEPARALDAARWFMAHRRPAGWQEWAEVVWRDPRTPRFIGDMPHTWVGSDMLRATLDLFGYTEGAPGAERLVVGAGIPAAWAADGVAVRGLVTPGGELAYRVGPARAGRVAVVFDALPDVPPGGIDVRAPFDADVARAEADGVPTPLVDGAVHLRSPARTVTFFAD